MAKLLLDEANCNNITASEPQASHPPLLLNPEISTQHEARHRRPQGRTELLGRSVGTGRSGPSSASCFLLEAFRTWKEEFSILVLGILDLMHRCPSLSAGFPGQATRGTRSRLSVAHWA